MTVLPVDVCYVGNEKVMNASNYSMPVYILMYPETSLEIRVPWENLTLNPSSLLQQNLP